MLRRLVAYLIIGAALTVFSAWVPLLKSNIPLYAGVADTVIASRLTDTAIQTAVQFPPEYVIIARSNAVRYTWYFDDLHVVHAARLPDGRYSWTVDFPGTIRRADAARGANMYVMLQSGWPLRALQGEMAIRCNLAAAGWGQIRTPAGFITVQIRGNEVFLPIQPLWKNAVINTFGYATICLMLHCGVICIRSAVRRRMNRCVKCGYDLRGQQTGRCPECGTQN
jgi:hypothetical protein